MSDKRLTVYVLLVTLIGCGAFSVKVFAQPRVRVLKNRRKSVLVRSSVREKKSADLMKEGIELLKKKNFGIAAERFRAVVKLQPRDLKARLLLAVCLIRLERNRQAYKLLENTLKIYPGNSATHYFMGSLLFKNRRFDKARRHLEQAFNKKAELKPDQVENTRKMLDFIADKNPRNVEGELSDEKPPQVSGQVEEAEIVSPSIEISAYSELEEKFKLAVFDFSNKNEPAVANNYGEIFAGMLTTALIKNKGFDIIERDQVKNLLNEQSLRMSGIVDISEAQNVGNLLGLDFVVIGSVSSLQGRIEIDLRLVRVDNGKAVLAESITAKGEDHLRSSAVALAGKIDQVYQQKGK